jgi:hypothetical protein
MNGLGQVVEGPWLHGGSGGWESRQGQGDGCAAGCGFLAALWQFGILQGPGAPHSKLDQCRAETFLPFPPHRAATMLNFKI